MDFYDKICRRAATASSGIAVSVLTAAALALLLIAPAKVYADMPTSQFLLVGQGARAEAMGESIVADCFDQTATYWNPAAMSFAAYPEIGLNSVPLVGGIMVNDVGFVYPGKKFSFGFRMITMGSQMDNYDSNGVLQSQGLSESDGNTDVFASYKLRDNLSLGIGMGSTSMKYSVPGITYSASTTNTNIGVVYKKDELALAASIDNIGGDVKLTDLSAGEPQPEVVRLGGAYKFLDDKNLTVAAAMERNIYDKNASGFRVGSEYAFNPYFAARGGFIFENNGDTRPTIGFGGYYAGFSLDFSSTISPSSMSDINTYRFGLSYKFGVKDTDD